MSAQPIGLDAAISRIQQIQTYQQQLVDPAAGSTQASTAAAGSSSDATPTGTTGTSGSSGSDFSTVLAALEEEQASASGSGSSGDGSGLSSLTGGSTALSALSELAGSNPTLASALAGASQATVGQTAAVSSTSAPAAVQAMTSQADALLGKPYVWGGGHSGWGEQTGYDCSGFVSKVLHAAGYLSSPQDTQTLPDQAGIESGPGQYVTIYDRTDAGSGQDHVIINLNGQFYESGGESAAWGGGGGVEKIARPSAAYLASFNRILHPAGL